MADCIIDQILDVVTLERARRDGLKYYSAEFPCVNGHIGDRYTSSRRCVECAKAAYRKDPKKVVDRSTAYRAANPDRAREWHKASYARHIESRRKKAKDYNEKNPHKKRIWNENNMDKVRAKHHRRRARKAGQKYHFTASQLRDLWATVKHACACCGININEKSRRIDHIVPLARGGNDTISNIQFLCASCNSQKWMHDPIKFMQSKGFLL